MKQEFKDVFKGALAVHPCSNTVYIGFYDKGFSGQSGYSDRNLVDGPLSQHNSDLGYNGLQF